METSESLIEKAIERLTKSGDSDVRRDANRRSPTDLDRPQAENTYYLRDIVGVLRERWLLFLLVLGLVAAPGVWLVMSLQPTYVATSKVIIEPNERMRLNVRQRGERHHSGQRIGAQRG